MTNEKNDMVNYHNCICAVYLVAILSGCSRIRAGELIYSGLVTLVGRYVWLSCNGLITDHIVRKIAHFTEYFILAGLAVHLSYLYVCRWKNILGYMLFGLLLVPVIDEFIQLFSAGRAGMIQDILLDFSGAVTGLVVVKALRKYPTKI